MFELRTVDLKTGKETVRDFTPAEIAEKERLSLADKAEMEEKEIKAQLADLDIRRVRPLAEGDMDYLSELNTEAQNLRKKLKELK